MKVLSRKNGLALIGVVVLLMILTLLVPTMINYSHVATSIAIKGTDQQKASYLARTGVEMAIAAYKTERDSPEYIEAFNELEAGVSADNLKPVTEIVTDSILLYLDKTLPENEASRYIAVDLNNPDDESNLLKAEYDNNPDRYTYVGKTDVSITFVGDTKLFKVNKTTSKAEDVTDSHDDVVRACLGGDINGEMNTLDADLDYYYMRMFFKQFVFTGKGSVNGVSRVRRANVLKTIDTAEETWINNKTRSQMDAKTVGIITTEGDQGLNEIFVNPSMATSRIPITYKDVHVDGEKVTEDLLLYSTNGNLIIDSDAQYSEEPPSALMTNSTYDWIKSYIPLVLTCNPGRRYNGEHVEGVSSDYLRGLTYTKSQTDVRVNNFIAFSASGTIQSNLLIDVCVAPSRRGYDGSIGTNARLGDIDNEKYASIYKAMMFNATDIIFKEKVINQISFLIPYGMSGLNVFRFLNIASGKRTGTVMLSAPENTPYTYYNKQRKDDARKTTAPAGDGGTWVKAGKVYFEKDVYVVVIDHDDEGTAQKVWDAGSLDSRQTMYKNYLKEIYSATPRNGTSEVGNSLNNYHVEMVTSYEEDGDYTVFKIFNAGDVYLFNTEVPSEYNGNQVKLGVSLVNWFLDTQFLEYKKQQLGGGSLWEEIKSWFKDMFMTAFYGLFQEGTYVASDMYYVGNIGAGTAEPAEDAEESLYVVWDS